MPPVDPRRPPARSLWPIVVAALGLLVALLWWLRGREVAGETDDVATRGASGGPDTRLGPRERPRPTVDLDSLRSAAIGGTISDPKGRPIAGAQVCATAQSMRLASGDRRTAQCAESGRDGRYRIGGLFGVDHRVVASAPRFIPAVYHHGEGSRRRDQVALRPAQERGDVDITLADGGVEIHGVVKDLSGGAVEGAQVEAGAGITRSGVDGSFRAWVGPGWIGVTARADGYADGVDRGAAPGHAFEVFLTPEAVLIGKVVRADDGSPVEGVQVRPSAGFFGYEQALAFTDAAGDFRIDGLQPGPYKAHAEADDLVGKADEQVILGLGETSAPIVVKVHPAFFVEGTIVVTDGTCDQGWVALEDLLAGRDKTAVHEGGGTYRARGVLPGDYEVHVNCGGFVPEERYPHVIVADSSVQGLEWPVSQGQAIRGVVVDGAGKPVEHVNVGATTKVDPSRARAHTTDSWGVETDADGRFALMGLLPGTYTLGLSSWSPPRAVPIKPIEVTVPEGRDLEDVKVVLPDTGEVKGSVRDVGGRPLHNVNVSIYDGVRGQDTATADDGSFRFPHVGAGEYRVIARRGWDSPLRAPGTGDDDVQGERVRVREGGVETVTLVVESSDARISGVVRDSDGAPVADAFIDSTRESDSAAQAAGSAARVARWSGFFAAPHLTDGDGRFVLDGLLAGKHTIRAHRKGGGEAIAEHVEPGADVVLTIAETGRMSGAVRTTGGEPPAEFSISLSEESTGFRRSDSFFRTGGAWSFPDLPAGKYKLRANAGGGSAELEVTMREGADTTGVTVELAPKVRVHGVVVDLEGAPVAGMRVIVSGAARGGGDAERRNVTDASGRYEVEHAPSGKVTVRVSPQNWQDAQHEAASVPLVIDGSAPEVELPALRVARRRSQRDEATGDFGYTLKESEPGADPLLRRHVVAVVRPGGPAARAGLAPGDELVSADGHDVTGASAYLLGPLTRVPVGTVVTFGLARGTSLAITASKRP